MFFKLKNGWLISAKRGQYNKIISSHYTDQRYLKSNISLKIKSNVLSSNL